MPDQLARGDRFAGRPADRMADELRERLDVVRAKAFRLEVRVSSLMDCAHLQADVLTAPLGGPWSIRSDV